MNLDNILSIHNLDIEVLFYFHNKFECYTINNFLQTRLVQESKPSALVKFWNGSPAAVFLVAAVLEIFQITESTNGSTEKLLK